MWFTVPWFVLATYSGEISNYYFFITRPVSLIILAYLFYRLLISPHWMLKFFLIFFLFYYGVRNTSVFLNVKKQGLTAQIKSVEREVEEGKVIKFSQGDPRPYIYYYLMKEKENK